MWQGEVIGKTKCGGFCGEFAFLKSGESSKCFFGEFKLIKLKKFGKKLISISLHSQKLSKNHLQMSSKFCFHFL